MSSGSTTSGWKDDLGPFFRPYTIAIVGASERNHYCQLAVGNLFRLGFPTERIFMVNPTRSEVYGMPTYPTLAAIGPDVDLAVLVVNRDRTLEAFGMAVAKGVKAVVVLASGFAEADEEGRRIQRELTAAAEAAQVLVCGPNCTGVADLAYPAAAYDGAGLLPDRLGTVSVVSQSGGLMNPIMETFGGRGVGLRRLVSVGNAAVLGPEDYVHYLADDPGTEVIVSYVEAFKNADRAIEALELAARRGTPVIMIKAGRSARSRRAVQSHTAGLVSSGLAWEGVLRQKGVVLVDNLDDLVETAVAMSVGSARPMGDALGFVTISGGDTSLFCDLADKHGLSLPDLSPTVRSALAALPGTMSDLGNPFDLAGRFRVGSDEFFTSLDLFAADEQFSLVTARVNLPKAPTPESVTMLERMREAVQRHDKPFVVFSRASERWDAAWYATMADLRIPFLEEFDKGCAALARWVGYERFLVGMGADTPATRSHARTVALSVSNGLLSYTEAAELVDAYGVGLAEGEVSHSAEEAVAIAERFGYPVVAKVDSRDIPHRSKVGGVVVGVSSADEVRRAHKEILAKVAAAVPAAVIDGVVIQRQVRGLLELIVGGAIDPQLGPLVLVGFGGVHVEYLKDVAVARAPLTSVEAHDLLLRLRGSRIFSATETSLGLDVDALVEMLCRISQLVADLGGCRAELDLNPVLVGRKGEGVQAVDVLVAVGSAGVGVADHLTG